jgi:NADP-dependent 3-hydroxy acid dehydrogenase YdfG
MKNSIITGASSGIGESTARILSKNGHRVLLLARNASKLESILAECGNLAESAICDVRNYESVQKAIAKFHADHGSIDVLINNAGLGFFDGFATGKIEEWHEMVDTNVKGLLNCIHAGLPFLIESKGHIINLGSVASHLVFPNSGVYCATKHAVFAISESIRMELPDKVRVTTISPGSVNTPFVDKTTNPDMLKEYKNYFAAGMSPELIAEQILHAINCPPGSVISEIVVRPSRAVK